MHLTDGSIVAFARIFRITCSIRNCINHSLYFCAVRICIITKLEETVEAVLDTDLTVFSSVVSAFEISLILCIERSIELVNANIKA